MYQDQAGGPPINHNSPLKHPRNRPPHSQSDNNVKLIILERLSDLKLRHTRVVQEVLMDILRALGKYARPSLAAFSFLGCGCVSSYLGRDRSWRDWCSGAIEPATYVPVVHARPDRTEPPPTTTRQGRPTWTSAARRWRWRWTWWRPATSRRLCTSSAARCCGRRCVPYSDVYYTINMYLFIHVWVDLWGCSRPA